MFENPYWDYDDNMYHDNWWNDELCECSIQDIIKDGRIFYKYCQVAIYDGMFGYRYVREPCFYDGKYYEFRVYEIESDMLVGYSNDEDVIEYFNNVLKANTLPDVTRKAKIYGITYDDMADV